MYPSVADDPNYQNALPADFVWGYASASFQIEGGRESRGDCLWDEFLAGKDNGDLAADSYNQFEEDLKLLKAYGATAYRFSIAWNRIIPKGGVDDPVSKEGIAYYRRMIDRLCEEGIEPWITIYHWDTPIELHRRYGGWVDHPQFFKDWLNYCRICFDSFGDKCTNWWTINEPRIFVKMNHAGLNPKWNPKTDPWKLGRVVLLAHARAVHLYRNDFQPKQHGKIGVVLDADWVEPLDDSEEAKIAAYDAVEAHFGWFADPLYTKTNNQVMQKRFGNDFVNLSDEELELVFGTSDDFFGLNHYGTTYATGKNLSADKNDALSFTMAGVERQFNDKHGQQIGIRGQNGHPYIVPWGFRKLLRLIKEKYIRDRAIPIVIAENGFAVDGEDKLSLEELVQDTDRQHYFADYIKVLVDAHREDGLLVRGYMAWSLMDNLEWMAGFQPRFGVTHIDRENGCKRTPKESAFLLKKMFEHLVTPL